ncbi:MAG: hypothetical protein OXG35_21825 [Acidobacteria bacterium]|nr:hypothetical protein [Acidobacteriota bacterium]
MADAGADRLAERIRVVGLALDRATALAGPLPHRLVDTDESLVNVGQPRAVSERASMTCAPAEESEQHEQPCAGQNLHKGRLWALTPTPKRLPDLVVLDDLVETVPAALALQAGVLLSPLPATSAA